MLRHLKALNPIFKFHKKRIIFSRLITISFLLLLLLLRIIFSILWNPQDVYIVTSPGKAVALHNPLNLIRVSEKFYPGDVIRVIKQKEGLVTSTLVYSDIRRKIWINRKKLAEKQMGKSLSSLFLGMLGGFKVELPLREKFASYGIAHLFAVSGTHIDTVGIILYALGLAPWMVFIAIFLYAFIVGFSPSIIRALAFFVVLSVYHFTGESHLDVLFMGVITTLVVAVFLPGYVFSISFLLSIAISLSILYSLQYKKYDVMLWVIWGLSVWFFSRLSIFTVVFPLISLFFTFLLGLSLLWLLIPLPFSGYMLSKILHIFTMVPYLSFPLDIFLPSYYAFIFVGILLWRIGTENKTLKHIGMVIIFLVVMIWLILTFYFPYKSVVVNVGEGDSIVLSSPESNILIDSGRPYEWVSARVLNALHVVGINYLDVILLTHEDIDHTGGFDRYLEDILKGRYGTVIRGGKVCGKNLIFSRDFFINFAPCDNYQWSDNERSAYVYFYHQWFLADLEGRGLTYFLNRYAHRDVLLKMPHHGSFDKMGTERLVRLIRPRYAVISVGKNPYGHPNMKTLSILHNYGVRIHRTDKEGSIVILVSRSGELYIVPLRYWWLYALKYIV